MAQSNMFNQLNWIDALTSREHLTLEVKEAAATLADALADSYMREATKVIARLSDQEIGPAVISKYGGDRVLIAKALASYTYKNTRDFECDGYELKKELMLQMHLSDRSFFG